MSWNSGFNGHQPPPGHNPYAHLPPPSGQLPYSPVSSSGQQGYGAPPNVYGPPPVPPRPGMTSRSLPSPPLASPPMGTLPVTARTGGPQLPSGNHMSSGGPPAQHGPSSDDDVYDLDTIHPLPPLRPYGSPNPVIYCCPGNRTLPFPATWYHLPSAPDFLMCSQCHAKRVAGMALAPRFVSVTREGGSCRFHSPRIRGLLRSACSTGNTSELEAVIAHRKGVPDCQGPGGVESAGGILWYRRKRTQLDNFIICAACYQDTVVSSPWAHEFEPLSQAQPLGQVWACDLSLPFNEQSFLFQCREVERNPSLRESAWATWVAGERRRAPLPSCNGSPVDPHSTAWYTTTRPINGLVICTTCYHDYIATTPFRSEFKPYPVPPNPGNKWGCDLATLQLKVAYFASRGNWNNFNVFWTAASKVFAISNGAPDQWVTLSGPANSFVACGKCVAGILEPLNVSGFFTPINIPPNSGATCDLCPGARSGLYLARLVEALDFGVWAYFDTFARTMVNIPECPRRQTRKDGVWYGFDALHVCPECWETFGKDTKLAKAVGVPLKGVVKNQHVLCSLYSPRMRAEWIKWGDMAAAGDAYALTSLLTLADKRELVYGQTMIPYYHMLNMKKMQLTQMQAKANAAVMFGAADSLNRISGNVGHYTNLHGVGGMYATQAGAQQAQANWDMTQIGGQMAGGWDQMAELERKWIAVE